MPRVDELRVRKDPPRFFRWLRAEFALCGRAARLSFVVMTHCSTKDVVLNSTVHPTQRRLVIALIVTLACLPLLVVDMLQGSPTSGATEAASSSSDSSLVVAEVPSTEAPATTIVVPAPEPEPVSTSVPAIVAPRAVQSTTTTSAPRVIVSPPPVVQSDEAFLACVRHRESRGDYTAADPTGTFLGAYQIYQGGWDSVASRIGRFDLIGIPPNEASPADQDSIAIALLSFSGRSPWGGSCG